MAGKKKLVLDPAWCKVRGLCVTAEQGHAATGGTRTPQLLDERFIMRLRYQKTGSMLEK